jgi:hypothetical protein
MRGEKLRMSDGMGCLLWLAFNRGREKKREREQRRRLTRTLL